MINYADVILSIEVASEVVEDVEKALEDHFSLIGNSAAHLLKLKLIAMLQDKGLDEASAKIRVIYDEDKNGY